MTAAAPDDAERRAADAACAPLAFDAAVPDAGVRDYLADPAVATMAGFFRAKGLAALKEEDRTETWYEDWIRFQAEHGLYAGLLSPAQWSSRGNRFDLRRLTRFMEVFAYFSPSHAYSLHVSFLGLVPILSGTNDSLKREAVARLEGGGLFGFAVSEKAHGSDLFSGEFTVRPAREGERGPWIADGEKYYIGNANAACMLSVLAVQAGAAADASRRAPFAFVAVRPGEAPAYGKVAKIRTHGIRSAHVGSFVVRGHPFGDADRISDGRDAWDAVFRTVDLGKFLLGFGAVGICEHAMTEALAHLRGRVLYGRPASEMPHLRATTAVAWARLAAMKMYAVRALDHLQVASKDDRRYLLFNAVQKARVSTEGVKLLALLAEAIGARGLEAETYFEGALRDAQLIPGLEGSTHINFGFAAQFAGPYFGGPRAGEPEPPDPPRLLAAPGENPFLFEARNRNPKTVRFARPLRAYEPLSHVANVRIFARQVEAFGRFVSGAFTPRDHAADGDVTISVGKCVACIAYAQLVAESSVAAGAPPSLVSVVFQTLVEDLSVEVLKLSAMLHRDGASRANLARAVRPARTSAVEIEETARRVDAWAQSIVSVAGGDQVAASGS